MGGDAAVTMANRDQGWRFRPVLEFVGESGGESQLSGPVKLRALMARVKLVQKQGHSTKAGSQQERDRDDSWHDRSSNANSSPQVDPSSP